MVAIAIYPYVTSPFYVKPEPVPFAGNKIYNPYSNIDTSLWLKCNFHGHTRVWGGITAGMSTETEDYIAKYKELDYDVIGISDYHDINPSSDMPAYEHGLGIFKNHQLSIGAGRILWKEYLFLQSFHNKQNIIEGLREEDNIISINHPELRSGYDGEDFKYLRGFDMIEVFNGYSSNASELWDSALSAGNPVFCLGNDDTHDIHDPKDFGFIFNLVNSASKSPGDIVTALKNGRSIAVKIKPNLNDLSPANKLKSSIEVPKPVHINISGDSVNILFNRACDTLKLWGQNGVIKDVEINASRISYKFKPEDTYIRAEIVQINEADIVLNPFFRYTTDALDQQKPEVDLSATWIYRCSIIIVLSLVLIIKIYRKKRKR